MSKKPLTKIQASARGERCTVYLDGYCKKSTDTTVLAHWTKQVPNSPRRSDTRAAYACVNCHDKLDGRESYPFMPYELEYVWANAIFKTHVKLIQKGLLKFEGIEPELPKQLPRRKM